MISRRDTLKLGMAAGAAAALAPTALSRAAPAPEPIITRPIPKSGERLPVVGLGSSATFSAVAGSEDWQRLRNVFMSMLEHGGTVFDTAPAYGASEEVAGQIVRESGLADKLFWATKLNVAQGGSADPGRARAQVETSFQRVGKQVIDLIQVHNMGDVEMQFSILKELREQRRIRYAGVTTTFPRQYELLEQTMRAEPLDFIGVDYAIDNRVMEERILPLAADRGIAVLAYAPFGRTRLWEKVRGREVPSWAAELGIRTWAQYFLKFVISHPAITCATPATSRPANVVDNMSAAREPLPDRAMRERMAKHIETL